MNEEEIVKWVLAGVKVLVDLAVQMGARRDVVLAGIDESRRLGELRIDDELKKKHPHG